MADKRIAYVQWTEEEASSGSSDAIQQVAYLVYDRGRSGGKTATEVLAYLGPHPEVTATLKEELAALYPGVSFDWHAIGRTLASPPGVTDVRTLSDDELALHLRQLAHERGLTLMDLALRLGYTQRQILPEVIAFLTDASSVARFERTSGSITEYLEEKHLDYAFLLFKARLFFEGDIQTLNQIISTEPRGFGDTAWQTRRLYWRSQMQAYREGRDRPPGATPT